MPTRFMPGILALSAIAGGCCSAEPPRQDGAPKAIPDTARESGATRDATRDTTKGATKGEAFREEIPGAAFSIEMLPIPGDEGKKIKPFFMSKTEISWDAYDAFLLNLDDEKLPALAADALTRPSRPYIPPDCGFGHAGYAVICVHLNNAAAYCAWLSARTGKAYRLASEEEWEHAARAGATTAYSFGDDEKALGEYAWFVDNSDEGPHPVGTKKPNAWGIFDMHGNVGEWVTTNDKDVKGNQGCVKGGSWQGSAEDAKVAARAQWEAPWQKTDPQIPKSKWWMSDGQHVGIRVVCEADESGKPRIVKPEKPASEVKAEPKESAPEK